MIGTPFRQEAAFDALLRPYRERADRIMVGMNLFLLGVCLAVAPLRATYVEVLLIGLPTLLLSSWLARHYAGELATRLFMACGFMVFTGLLIHQTGGDIEAHFAAFGLVGVLLYYRDWRTIAAATLFIYLHHLVLGYAQTLGAPIYVFDDRRFWLLFGLHVAYFLPFVAMMGYLSVWLRREGYESQHVIDLAQRIVQGHLLISEEEPRGGSTPLISAVRQMKLRLLDLLRVMPVAAAVIRIDSEQVVNVNEAWLRTLGPLAVQGGRFGESPIWADPATWAALLDRLRATSEKLLDKVEVVLRRTDGTPILCELSLILHDEMVPVMAILTVEDITLRRQSEKTMQRLAFTDMLTELPNRARLYQAFHEALALWENQGTAFAFVALDLDGFKPVNDTYGHDVGDELLRIIAARFQHALREGDVLGRMGSDEFGAVLNDCRDSEAAAQVAQRFVDAVARPFYLKDGAAVIQLGISAGVVHVSQCVDNPQRMPKGADEALYRAKAAGKNQVAA
jgi:diguanylate cyclase (GGDEF)-like protein